jgi:hypothetical protein
MMTQKPLHKTWKKDFLNGDVEVHRDHRSAYQAQPFFAVQVNPKYSIQINKSDAEEFLGSTSTTFEKHKNYDVWRVKK